MLTVACVYKTGKDYDREYVERLEEGVHKHLTVPHGFVCLSDRSVPCVWSRLEHDWPGWWSKMELYRLEPPVLYFDLDTIITGNLDDIARAAVSHPFIALRDFYREKGLGSGMMAWAEPQRALYETFSRAPYYFMDRYGKRGDQAFLEDRLKPEPAKWQRVVSGQVCSYKADIRDKGVPENCRVVCFHGRPRPREIEWNLYPRMPSAE